MKKMIALTILAGVGGVVYWQKHRDFFKRLDLVLQRQGIEVIQVTEMAAHLLGASEREFYSLGQSKVPKFSISTDVVDFFYVNFFKIFRCICCMLL